MATDPRDALSQLAYSCIKHIPVENLSEEEQDSFAKAFSNPNSPYKEKPQLFNVPEPIPDIDFPEPEPVKEVEIDEQAKGGEELAPTAAKTSAAGGDAGPAPTETPSSTARCAASGIAAGLPMAAV